MEPGPKPVSGDNNGESTEQPLRDMEPYTQPQAYELISTGHQMWRVMHGEKLIRLEVTPQKKARIQGKDTDSASKAESIHPFIKDITALEQSWGEARWAQI
ncbi:hypothetical protein NDU88_002402 [Pleurodeles waltl]|uniref:Uncharacterized protein n=1 Tax=Pleurodeles waltl TaxID=8319 RepID=A0AAV7PF63_PLEWA|nr:hypothetical protein NDU88_002402 [Pleurodeles waltl]